VSIGAWVAVAVAGGFGAGARFGLDRAVAARLGEAFPYGTLLVNVSGAFALGLLAGAGVHGDARRIAAVGFLGGYTTFSTWMVETARLPRGRAELYLGLSVALGLAAAALGRTLA
jgi:CrcB protein